MNGTSARKLLTFAGILAFGLLFVMQARGDTIEVKKQPLASALLEFSEQTGLQIAYVATLARGKVSHGTRGRASESRALTDILKGTDLKHQFVNSVTVAIGPDPTGPVRKSASGWSGSSNEMILVTQSQNTEDENTEEPDEPEESESAAREEEEPLRLSEQRVTGSRLKGGDPSAQVYVFGAEEIARRGVSSMEEFFRTLPWQFSTQNTQTGMYGSERTLRGDGLTIPDVDVGVATINLRALGSKNTLVLRDGRRIAGVGGVEEDVFNLLDMPLSAIDRVEIQLDGASAVYGADAIGGVVNFITKKDYQGLAASARQEFSSTGADTRKFDITGGYAWGSGKVTAILSHSDTKPVLNKKIWTSLDLRPLLGFDYDRRAPANGQPGVVCRLYQYPQPTWTSNPPRHSCWAPSSHTDRGRQPVYFQLPSDHSGENAQISDFITSSYWEAARYDEVPPTTVLIVPGIR